MASAKQLAANRLNAQRSSGPKSEEGKRRSSVNALRHGLTVPVEFSGFMVHLPPLQALLVADGLEASQARELALRILDYERNVEHLPVLLSESNETSLPPPAGTKSFESAAQVHLLAEDSTKDFTRKDKSLLRKLGKLIERVDKHEARNADRKLRSGERHYRRAANQLLKGLRSLNS